MAGNAFVVNLKFLHIRLNGPAAVAASAATIGAGGYFLWKITNNDDYMKALVKSFQQRGATIADVTHQSIVVSVIADNEEVAKRIQEDCDSDEILREINTLLDAFDEKNEDKVGNFESISIVHTDRVQVTMEQWGSIKQQCQENVQTTIKEGLKPFQSFHKNLHTLFQFAAVMEALPNLIPEPTPRPQPLHLQISSNPRPIMIPASMEATPTPDDILASPFQTPSLEHQPEQHSCGFLVIGGEGSEQDCIKYNTVTKEPQRFPELNHARAWLTSGKVEGKVYAMGGRFSSESCEMLDLEKRREWIRIADMPEPRRDAASTVVDGRIYVTGGSGEHSSLSSCSVYDAQNNRWEKSFDMLHRRCSHGVCSIDNSIYCIGGFDGDFILQSCERYDLRTKVPSRVPSMKQERHYLACVEVEGLIYAIGGTFGDPLQTVERYEPRANIWEYISPLSGPRWGHCAFCVEGNVYVVGGVRNDLEPVTTVEVYNPRTDRWKNDFEIEHPSHGATVVVV